jgi:hypothetical protein
MINFGHERFFGSADYVLPERGAMVQPSFLSQKSRLRWVATASIHPTNCKSLELETGWCECTEEEKQIEGSGKTPEIAVSRLLLAFSNKV